MFVVAKCLVDIDAQISGDRNRLNLLSKKQSPCYINVEINIDQPSSHAMFTSDWLVLMETLEIDLDPGLRVNKLEFRVRISSILSKQKSDCPCRMQTSPLRSGQWNVQSRSQQSQVKEYHSLFKALWTSCFNRYTRHAPGPVTISTLVNN